MELKKRLNKKINRLKSSKTYHEHNGNLWRWNGSSGSSEMTNGHMERERERERDRSNEEKEEGGSRFNVLYENYR